MRRLWQNGMIILECVHEQDIFDLRWRPLRSSGYILSRLIMSCLPRSIVILEWRPLSRCIVWRPLRSSSILISFLITVIQFVFLAPRKTNRSQPFICCFRGEIGLIKVGTEAIRYNKVQPFYGVLPSDEWTVWKRLSQTT